MLRKLIWFAITSGLAKRIYTEFRNAQRARRAGPMPSSARRSSSTDWRSSGGPGSRR